MESLDNIISDINKFDISIVNIDNVNQIFKKLDSIISICEDKILSCANKIDNEDSNVTVEVNNEVDDKLNEFMELTKETKKEDEVVPKKRTTRKQTPKTTKSEPKPKTEPKTKSEPKPKTKTETKSSGSRVSARRKKKMEEESLIADE